MLSDVMGDWWAMRYVESRGSGGDDHETSAVMYGGEGKMAWMRGSRLPP
jgi:hypothetical protein